MKALRPMILCAMMIFVAATSAWGGQPPLQSGLTARNDSGATRAGDLPSAGGPRAQKEHAAKRSRDMDQRATRPEAETSQAVRIIVSLTLLAVIPAALVCATAFLRIVIVLSMLRHAIGLPETPPNMVLVGLAVFLTLFTMGPVFGRLNDVTVQPFLRGDLSMDGAYRTGMEPLKDFMLRQTKRQDIDLMAELASGDVEVKANAMPIIQLIPAFMLSELRSAFQIGVLVFLPFLLVDLVVASVLMALGMMMVPPATIALPLKLLMFVLVDGWSLLLRALVGSFH